MWPNQKGRGVSGSYGRYTHSPYNLSYTDNINTDVRCDNSQRHCEQNCELQTENMYQCSNNNNSNEEQHQQEQEQQEQQEQHYEHEMILENDYAKHVMETESGKEDYVEVHEKLSIPSSPLNQESHVSYQTSLQKEGGENNTSNNSIGTSSSSKRSGSNNRNNSNSIRTNSRSSECTESSTQYNAMCNTANEVSRQEQHPHRTPPTITTTTTTTAVNTNNKSINNNTNGRIRNIGTIRETAALSKSSSVPINVQPRHGRSSHGVARWNTSFNGLPLSPSNKVYYCKSASYSSSSAQVNTQTDHSQQRQNQQLQQQQQQQEQEREEQEQEEEEEEEERIPGKAHTLHKDTSVVTTHSNSTPRRESENVISVSTEESRPHSLNSMNYFQPESSESVEQTTNILMNEQAKAIHGTPSIPNTYAPVRFMAHNNLHMNRPTRLSTGASVSSSNININSANHKNVSSINTNMESSASTLGSPFNRSYNESAQISYSNAHSPLPMQSLPINNNNINNSNNNNNNMSSNNISSNHSLSQHASTPIQATDIPRSVNANFNPATMMSTSSSYSPPYRTNVHHKSHSLSNYNSNSYNNYNNNNNNNNNNSSSRSEYNSYSGFQINQQYNLSHSYHTQAMHQHSPLPSASGAVTQLNHTAQSPESSFASLHYDNNSLASAPSYMEYIRQQNNMKEVNNDENVNYCCDGTSGEAIPAAAAATPAPPNTTTINNNNNNIINNNNVAGLTGTTVPASPGAALPRTLSTSVNLNNNKNNNDINNVSINFSSNMFGGPSLQGLHGNTWNRSEDNVSSYNTAPIPLQYPPLSSSPLATNVNNQAALINFSAPATYLNNISSNIMSSSSYNSNNYRQNMRRGRSFSLTNNFLRGNIGNSHNNGNINDSNDDTLSVSSKSCSNASSVRDNLELCPKDEECPLINDQRHQRQFAHTCRLFPCYHGHIVRHAKLFRHTEGQIAQQEGLPNGKISAHALTSVNFSSISHLAPNAYRIYVTHGEKSYEIFGDWASVRVHTFKRYLHQVCHIPPHAQVLMMVSTNKVMDDEISSVKEYGVEADCEILLKLDIELDEPGLLLDDL